MLEYSLTLKVHFVVSQKGFKYMLVFKVYKFLSQRQICYASLPEPFHFVKRRTSDAHCSGCHGTVHRPPPFRKGTSMSLMLSVLMDTELSLSCFQGFSLSHRESTAVITLSLKVVRSQSLACAGV